MKPAVFRYLAPTTLRQAVELLADHGATGKLLAGGQSLVPAMNFRLARPEVLVDLNRVPGLDRIEAAPDALRIGALARHAAFHRPVCGGPLGRLLARVVQHIAHYPIRQRGTFGGSLAHADPASEWCLVAATLGAEMAIAGPAGDRRLGAEAWFRGAFTTALAADEILTEVSLPMLPDAPGNGAGFCEFARRQGDFALAMALAVVALDRGTIRAARVGIGAVSEHARRLAPVEAALVGQPATAEACARAGAMVPALVAPHGDIHGSADYRRELAGVMVTRALEAALADAGGAAA